jgi:membrane-associated phospholipid phosphatase
MVAAPRRWRLLPAEWAVLAFVVYAICFVTIRLGPAALGTLRPDFGSRELRVMVALGFVSTVLQVHAAVLCWPKLSDPHRRAAVAFGAASLVPLMGSLMALSQEHAFWKTLASEPLRDSIHDVTIAFLRVAALSFPTVLLWTAWTQHLAIEGAFRARIFVVGSLKSAASTLREWAPIAFFIPAYAWMADLIGTPVGRDSIIASFDRALFLGHDPLDLLQAIIVKPLNEWAAFSYSFYGVMYPLCLGALLVSGGRAGLRTGVTALSLGFAVTFISYTLIPVKGPVLSRAFDVPLDFYIIEDLKIAMMDQTRITWDCFPSFHTAGSVLMSWACWRHSRRVFWATLPMVITIPFACVYLRYHYVTDVLAGLALAFVITRLVPRWLEKYSA